MGGKIGQAYNAIEEEGGQQIPWTATQVSLYDSTRNAAGVYGRLLWALGGVGGDAADSYLLH